MISSVVLFSVNYVLKYKFGISSAALTHTVTAGNDAIDANMPDLASVRIRHNIKVLWITPITFFEIYM